MQKHHLIAVLVAFLLCALSTYYGIQIWNANQNHLITELNEYDQIFHEDVKYVPLMSIQAAIITAPFLLALLVLEILILRKSTVRQVKNIAIGLLLALAIIIVIDVLTILDPYNFDFSKWGFVWICLGLFVLGGNALSAGINRFKKPKEEPGN